MKIKSISALIVLFFVTCSKENIDKQLTANQSNAVEVLNIVKIPLNDLGTGTFNGYVGGLYPGGANKPFGQYATDLLATSQSIVPTDTFGLPSTLPNAVILFMSMGGSTGGHNMKMLKSKTIDNPATNSKLKLISCNNGSGEASLNSIGKPNAAYWNHVTQIIKGTKSSYRQVQVLYLETEDTSRLVKFPGRPQLVKASLQQALKVMKQKFPNLKIVYVLGRSRTFGTLAPWNKEPSPYYFGWACKWAIEDQMNGVPGTEYKGSNAVSPMITWGFYQWADTMPRKTDGFAWLPEQTADGLHATYEGQDTLATRFQQFLLTDKYASIWYAND